MGMETRTSFEISELREQHWQQVRAIYAEGIATGLATFETDIPSWESWDARHLSCCRLIAQDVETIKGWAALSVVSARSVYAGVAEVSVYVGEKHRGEGVGRALLEALVRDSEQSGIWMLQASIFALNVASVRLHARCGFRTVGSRERIARLNGRWLDTILMERRSLVVGVD
ncbi:MAG TPA: GNAT family N-acetyltransferase [Pyrinomonadaceae bacterium]|jgi:phosphinothricin acetyltransferase